MDDGVAEETASQRLRAQWGDFQKHNIVGHRFICKFLMFQNNACINFNLQQTKIVDYAAQIERRVERLLEDLEGELQGEGETLEVGSACCPTLDTQGPVGGSGQGSHCCR